MARHFQGPHISPRKGKSGLIDRMSEVVEGFFAFLAKELAPSHRRIIEAARNATKTTITTGLAATMQIVGPFGPLFAFRIGQPGVSLGIFEGALTIAIAAVMQAAIVPITGRLLDYPGLIMALLFVIFAAITYLSSNTRLFMLIALTAVGTITTIYVGIFRPGQIGWGSTYTFDGILVATLVMVAFDTLIWPSPAEPRLLESIAADFDRTRGRLELVGRRYLDRFAPPLPPPHLTSTLASNLVLLESVKEHMKPTPQRLAALLDAVMTAERVRLEVERLALLADERVSDEMRQKHRPNLEQVLTIADEALAQRTESLLSGLPGTEKSLEPPTELTAMIRRQSHLIVQTLPAAVCTTSADASNLLGFVSGLETLADLLETRERPSNPTAAEPAPDQDGADLRPRFQPAAFRLSVKIGTAMTLALLVGLTTQRADLQTILWSVVVAGLPNTYGAVVRKTILRLAGCLVGGLAALGAMIIVSQNFDSLPAYLAAIFAVTIFSTYVAQSSEWLGYAGIQAGITFLICYVGLGPSSNVYAPLWRFWGIVLGVLTTGFVFLLLWQEFASDKLIEALRKLMRTTLAFGKETAEGKITEERIVAIERRLSADLVEVLAMADQARLEGRRGTTNSAAGIDAAATLIRIAYRFEIIARGRLSGSEAILPKTLLERRAAVEEACCSALAYQLENFGLTESFEQPAPSSAAPPPPPADLKSTIEELAAGGTLESAHWPPGARSVFVAQLEAYRRLPILLASLDVELSKIAAS